MKGKNRRGRFSWVPNFYLILVLLILYLPTFVVVAYSFNQQKDGLKWTGFTTEWYPKSCFRPARSWKPCATA